MTHEIKDQHDEEIGEDRLRDEIIFAIEQDMTFTYFDDRRIDIVSHTVDPDGNKITVVEVDYE